MAVDHGGTPEAEATSRGQLVIMKMKGRQTMLGECCTQCMLYSVYALLGVNSWSWHGEMERDDLTFCSAIMVKLCKRKREMGEEDENDVEDMSGYEKLGVRLAWSGWEDLVSEYLHCGSGLIPAVSGMVNWLAHENLRSPSFSWWFPPYRLISLFLVLNSTITWEQEVKSSVSISPCHDQELTPSTAYTAYCIIPRSTVSRSQPVSHLFGRPWCTQFSTFPQLWVNRWIESQLPSRLPLELPPPDGLPPSTPLISLDHGLQVHLQTRSIATSKCISPLAQLWPPNSIDHGLRVPLQTRSITAPMCISKLARLRPPSSHKHGFQMHPQTRLITASKCIFKLSRLRPPSSHKHGPQVRLQTH